MLILDSAIARWMLAILTIGVGIITLQTQSDFWFGVLITLGAIWVLRALGGLVVARAGKKRASEVAFLVASAACLAYGFGPWSDASMRGDFPPDARSTASYVKEILPTTIAFLRISRYIKPSPRAEIRIFDGEGRLVARIGIDGCGPGRLSQMDSVVDGLTNDLEWDLNPGMDIFARTYSGPGYAIVPHSLDVYFHACYLLASLAIGGIVGSVVGTKIVPNRSATGPKSGDEILDARSSALAPPG